MEVKVSRLVQRCIADLGRHPVEHVDVYLGDDLLVWYLVLHYPEAAPFVGGSGGSITAPAFSLYFVLRFHEDFPARPPRLTLLSPWTNHQHLWGSRVCHSLLTDDFADFFAEKRTHGTSMWNASCALADKEGIGGMPRYLQILREYLSSDVDFDEEQHVKYDESSLIRDACAQNDFKPDFLEFANRLEPDSSIAPGVKAIEAGPGDAKLLESAPLADVQVDLSALAAPLALASTSSLPAAPDTPSALDGPPVVAAEPWGVDFFLKCPLVAGDPETHPCFDVTLARGRVPLLSSTMTSLCMKSFDLGARTTDFGTPIVVTMPHPCSYESWMALGSSLATAALEQLAPIASHYQLQLPGIPAEAERLERILNVVGEIWKTTCIGIVKDEGYESERAMACFVTLHFVLLCFAREHPDLKAHAVATVREFLHLVKEAPEQNLKTCVPDLGRFLVRFLLSEGDVGLQDNLQTVLRELFNRNVRWVDRDFWPTADVEDDEDKEEQIEASFEASQFGMKLTAFQSYYILRSSELGLDTLEAHEACCGKPSAETLRVFQQDCTGIKDLGSYEEFFVWLKLEELLGADVHKMLSDAVEESDIRGYNAGLPPRG